VNPYAPPLDADDLPAPNWEEHLSAGITMLGVLLATAATAGAGFKLANERTYFDWRQLNTFLGNGSGVFGILAFAVAAWILLGLMSSMGTRIRSECEPFSKGLVLLAIVAMCARLVIEPVFQWTPELPSYCLTFAAAIAMLMVLKRVRHSLQCGSQH